MQVSMRKLLDKGELGQDGVHEVFGAFIRFLVQLLDDLFCFFQSNFLVFVLLFDYRLQLFQLHGLFLWVLGLPGQPCLCEIVRILKCLLILSFHTVLQDWSRIDTRMDLFHILIAKLIQGQVVQRPRSSDISRFGLQRRALAFEKRLVLLFNCLCIHCFLCLQHFVVVNLLGLAFFPLSLLFIDCFKECGVAVTGEPGLLNQTGSQFLRLSFPLLLIHDRNIRIPSRMFFNLTDLKLLLLSLLLKHLLIFFLFRFLNDPPFLFNGFVQEFKPRYFLILSIS